MKLVSVQFKLDERQEFYSLPLIERNGGFFVANPHADIPHQSAEVKLDPKRLVTLPEMPETLSYTGVLLEIRSLPEA
jgi:hypothetical protein